MTTPWDGRTVRGAVPGRVGGLSRSRAKARAARENGKLGGRPKNKTKVKQAEERAAALEAEAAALRARLATAEAALAAKAEPAPDKRPAPTVDRFGLIELD
jgi:hypothetical protein